MSSRWLVCFAFLPQLALADVILTYTVSAYKDPNLIACATDSPPSLFCSPALTTGYTNTITLISGVPQTAELLPLTITMPPSSMLFTSGPLLPTIDLWFTNTATGVSGHMQAQLPLQYNTGTPISYVSQKFSSIPIDFNTSGLSLRIVPTGVLGPAIPGAVTTYPAMATFLTPAVPEPSTVGLLGLGVLALWGVRRRRFNSC